MIRKKSYRETPPPKKKNFARKNLLFCRNYIQTLPFTLYLNRLFPSQTKRGEKQNIQK